MDSCATVPKPTKKNAMKKKYYSIYILICKSTFGHTFGDKLNLFIQIYLISSLLFIKIDVEIDYL